PCGRVRSSPAVADGLVVVGSADAQVYCVRLNDGALVSQFATDGAALASRQVGLDRRTVQSSPAVVDSTVYVGARDGFLYARDARTGRLRWRVDHNVSWVITSPSAASGLVNVGSYNAHLVQPVDTRTGANS